VVSNYNIITVEIYNTDDKLLETAEFPSVPRSGEHIAMLTDDYFKYFHVIKTWYRREEPSLSYVACIEVELDD
jgi:hypothetical protein